MISKPNYAVGPIWTRSMTGGMRDGVVRGRTRKSSRGRCWKRARCAAADGHMHYQVCKFICFEVDEVSEL